MSDVPVQTTEAAHQVAHTAITSQEGIAVGRVAAGEDMVEGQVLAVDDGGIFSGKYVATADGFAVRQIASDGDVVVEETMVAVVDSDAAELADEAPTDQAAKDATDQT